MKAWVLHSVGEIRLEEKEKPEPNSGEVRVKVKAAGICGSDVPRIYETGAHRMPIVPGHEFSGLVDKVGDGVSLRWLGECVSVFPMIPCRKCALCREKRYELCRNYDYLGSRCDGAFAEYVVVPAENLIALPTEVTYAEAAMLEPMAVAVHAMRRGTDNFSLAPENASVAVCGLGAIGLLMVMFLLEAGYKNLYLIGKHDFQREKALELGVENWRYHTVRNAAEWLQKQTGGVDLFFECAGQNNSAALGVESTGAGGRIVLVGNPHTDMTLSQDVYWNLLRNQITVTGTWNSSFYEDAENDWKYALNRLSSKRVTPEKLISHRLPMRNLEYGLAIIRGKREAFCKALVLPEDGT